MIPAFQILEQDHFPLLRRERLEGREQRPPQLGALDGLRCVRSHRLRHVLQRRPASHPPVLPQVAGMVAYDLHHPVREPRRLAALVDALERPHERVLTCVLGVRRVAQHRQRHHVRCAVVTAHEAVGRARIPAAHPLHQVLVGGRIRAHAVPPTPRQARRHRR